jgi:hypothetical protein
MTNWQLIITLATLVFAIFGANWLSLQLLKSYIDARFDTIRAELGTLRAENQAGQNEVRAEIRHLGEKVDRIDQIFQRLYQPVVPGKAD